MQYVFRLATLTLNSGDYRTSSHGRMSLNNSGINDSVMTVIFFWSEAFGNEEKSCIFFGSFCTYNSSSQV
jgi:hypothetical protein